MIEERATVALTGATGFVGRRLVPELVANGWHVKALVRSPDHGLPDTHLTPVDGTIQDQNALRTLIDGCDAVIHCAGAIKGWHAKDFMAVNCAGTERLAHMCTEAPQPPRFVFISTLAAREPHLSPYAASKRAGEDVLRGLDGRLDWWAVRPPVIYGPSDRETFQIFKAMSAGFAPIPSKQSRFSLIHVDDFAGAVRHLLSDDLPARQIVEVRDNQANGYSWQDLSASAAEILGRSVRTYQVPRSFMTFAGMINFGVSLITGLPPMVTPAKVRELYHPDWVCRTNEIAELTPWQPAFDLRKGLDQTFSWYKSEGWI